MDGYAVRAEDVRDASEDDAGRAAGRRRHRGRRDPGRRDRPRAGRPHHDRCADARSAPTPSFPSSRPTAGPRGCASRSPRRRVGICAESARTSRRATPCSRAGTFLGAAQIGLLAAVGKDRVKVRPRPRVVVISTGRELVEPGLAAGARADHRLQLVHADRRRPGGRSGRLPGRRPSPTTRPSC